MNTLLLVIAAIICVAAGIWIAVRQNIQKQEAHRYYEAAKRIIQEDCLNYSIKNPANNCEKLPRMQKLMIGLRVEKAKGKGYVFDPEKGVFIGREKGPNEICLQEITVSGQHCWIYLQDNKIYLEDLHSSNGTFLKRRFQGLLPLYGTAKEIQSRDKILVGSTCFRLTVFYCDMIAM